MTQTLTIDADSITVIFAAEEIGTLAAGSLPRALRLVAEAMQRVADAHDIDVTVEHDATSGKRRGEDESLWERLAIALADEVRAEAGL